jgi:hypothetical protein
VSTRFEVIERYVHWREACSAVRDAYDEWSRASAVNRPLSFAAYRAALDQEEAAAALLRRGCGAGAPGPLGNRAERPRQTGFVGR